MVKDKLALSLEKRKLWRRASNRWLELYRDYYFEDSDLDWLRARSKYCLTKVERPSTEYREDVFPGYVSLPANIYGSKYFGWN